MGFVYTCCVLWGLFVPVVFSGVHAYLSCSLGFVCICCVHWGSCVPVVFSGVCCVHWGSYVSVLFTEVRAYLLSQILEEL